MNPIETSNIDFEILISTVSQTSLDFLIPQKRAWQKAEIQPLKMPWVLFVYLQTTMLFMKRILNK